MRERIEGRKPSQAISSTTVGCGIGKAMKVTNMFQGQEGTGEREGTFLPR